MDLWTYLAWNVVSLIVSALSSVVLGELETGMGKSINYFTNLPPRQFLEIIPNIMSFGS